MLTSGRRRGAFWSFRVLLAIALLGAAACEQAETGATLRRIESPSQLIGGPKALGTLGDYLMENGQLRVIIQNNGYSRGFGVYGGGIIDADIVRPGAGPGQGQDTFGEMFSGFFLAAMQPRQMEIVDDGSASGVAHLRVTGRGADFIAMVSELTPAMLDPVNISVQVDYVLRPGARHVEVTTSLINRTDAPVSLNRIKDLLAGFDLELGEVPMPAGDVVLFGDGNTPFIPGLPGFDIRYALEDVIYKQRYDLPAFPGLVADFIATAGAHVSYGIAVPPSDNNYVWRNRAQYLGNGQPAARDSLLVPFLFESFTGAYHTWLPDSLPARGQYSFTKWFMVGDGDVASIRDIYHELRGDPTGQLAGRVLREQTFEPETEAWVIVTDSAGRPYSQLATDARGYFKGQLPPGDYGLRLLAPARAATGPGELPGFALAAGEQVFRELSLPRPGRLLVDSYDRDGNRLPARVTVVGTYGVEHAGRRPQDFLFDLKVGEARRPTDLTWLLDPARGTRQYIEVIQHSGSGRAELELRPGEYQVVVSRGIEYDVWRGPVTISAGQVSALAAVLTRVVETTGYVAGDLHVHTLNSLDSATPISDRVRSVAAEGLEFVVATDHNYITDYGPEVARQGLQEWVHPVIGLEYTTFEMGHFNAYPLRYDPGAPTRGRSPFTPPPPPGASAEERAAFNALPEWQRRPNRPRSTESFRLPDPTGFEWAYLNPREIFGELRSLGSLGPDKTIVQVNHPRDAILGYFNQFFLDTRTAVPRPPTDFLIYPHNNATGQWDCQNFSYGFDALELLNGMRLDRLHGARLPLDIDPATLAALPAGNQPGGLLLDERGQSAYPGVIDDWFNLLNRGYRVTGVGNSDSHGLGVDQVGSPRTYLRVDADAVAALDDLKLVDALKGHRAIVTNGPFVDLLVDTDENPASTGVIGRVGQLLADPNGRVQLIINLQCAPWMRVDRMRLWGNGVLLHEWDASDGLVGYNADDPTQPYAFVINQPLELRVDTWLVIEVLGDGAGRGSMWPIYGAREEQPTNLDTAVGGIAANLGFEFNRFAELRPSIVQQVYPYAITNPIWLDVDGDGVFTPPQPRAVSCAPWANLPARPDVRRLLDALP